MTTLRASVGLAMLAIVAGASARAEDFVVGGYALSDYLDTGSGETVSHEYWDDDGHHRASTVTLTSDELILRYKISAQSGKLDEVPDESHHMTVYATDRRQAFLIDFKGPLNSRGDTRSPDFVKTCARDVAALGGATRSIGGNFPGALPYSMSLVVDRDMAPDARARTLAIIDAWLTAPDIKRRRQLSSGDLTRTLKFKKLAAVLGPEFRGAIVVCGFTAGMEPIAVWETRFLDLPLAATVFNLSPE